MLSLDSQVLLLVCSRLGLAGDSDLAPLTLREWNPLARKIQASAFQRPQELLGQGVEEIQQQLELPEAEAERLVRLLQRTDSLAIELERLASKHIHVMTRIDSDYPQRYRQRLKEFAPAALFYVGEPALLGQPGIAVVGSRHLDQAGQECATFVGNACGLSGLVLYSGGAKGVDTISMNAALEARGSAVGILADSLERSIRDSGARSAMSRGDLCLATPYSPGAGFSVGAAMGRATDIALESADMVIMRPDLRLVADAVALSKKTFSMLFKNPDTKSAPKIFRFFPAEPKRVTGTWESPWTRSSWPNTWT